MPGKDVADFFFGEEGFVRLSWDVITHVIDFLMQNSEYIPLPTIIRRITWASITRPGTEPRNR